MAWVVLPTSDESAALGWRKFEKRALPSIQSVHGRHWMLLAGHTTNGTHFTRLAADQQVELSGDSDPR